MSAVITRGVALLLPVVLLSWLVLTGDAVAIQENGGFDSAAALKVSQSAIGHGLGDYRLTNVEGQPVPLSRYRGKPLVVSLVYTSCYHICSVTTRYLLQAVRAARQVLEPQSFAVLTIGFDTSVDTPLAMRNFARVQGIDLEGWEFLSADAETMASLTRDLGFLSIPSPRGFEHTIQATLIDAGGIVQNQVYGDLFPIPQLVEPLKRMILGTGMEQNALDSLWAKVRLFCTTYDPSSDRYYFDYSLFIGMGIGASILIAGIAFLLNETKRGRRT